MIGSFWEGGGSKLPKAVSRVISNTHKVNDPTWGETEKMEVKNSHFDGKILLT